MPRILLLMILASLCARAADVSLPPPDEQTVPVADETATDDAAPDAGGTEQADGSEPAAGATDEDRLAFYYRRYLQLISDRVYDEADSAAKRVVELTLSNRGPKSTDYSKALINLAIVQHYNKQYDAAQQNFLAAIEIIERNEDRLNVQLVNPLKGLGVSQLDAGKPELAGQTFGRAIHVTHVNNGPHNLQQIEILESLAEANLRRGLVNEARDIQERIFALNAHAYSTESMEFVPSLMRRADWQHRAGLIADEQVTLRRAIRIIEEQVGNDDPQLVEPLIRLGRTYFYPDTSTTSTGLRSTLDSGEIFFKRAVRIAAENPATDWQVVARASLALGDFYMFDNNWQRAHIVYQEAWNFLSDSDEGIQFRRDNLERPILLRERALRQHVSLPGEDGAAPNDAPLLDGSMTLAFEISASGRTSNLRIIEAQPVNFPSMQHSVQREMRSRLYRPRFVDAEAADSDEQLLEHRFYYTQTDLDALQQSAAAESDSGET